MSDVINFAHQGIPSVGLITERFSEEAAFAARSAGMPDAPWLELPYPIAGSADDWMHRLAVDTVPRIIASLRDRA